MKGAEVLPRRERLGPDQTDQNGCWLIAVYWPRYHPIPYRSKKLVIMVSEFA